MKTRLRLSTAALLCVLLPIAAPAQSPAEAGEKPPEIEITKFRVEPAQAPGGGKPWLRLLADFDSRPAWADGVVFYYDVLVAKGDDMRVLSGTARYSNVKRGSHAAVLYMSPSAFERFGAPIAAIVRSSYKDEPSGQIDWRSPQGGSSATQGWDRQMQRYSGQLMPINITPFVASEYGKFPDILAPR